MKCLRCDGRLIFVEGRGWVHVHGGGAYMMKCDRCGHKSARHPSPTICPSCGATKEWKDDHCALPNVQTREANIKGGQL